MNIEGKETQKSVENFLQKPIKTGAVNCKTKQYLLKNQLINKKNKKVLFFN